MEGVRARLLSPKESYQVGKPLVLTLEIQNVSAAEVSLDEPQLMPLISYPRSHPYRKHSYPWVITCETPESPPHILWGARAARDRVPAQLRLEPGVTHRVEIIGVSLREEIDLDRPRKRGQQQREEVQFVGADDPGVYLFKATFALRAAGEQKGAGRASVWKRRPSGSR